MKFEWDAAKSRRNLRERRVSFDVVVELFAGHVVEFEDTRRDYGERRVKAVGEVEGVFFACIYTDRDDVRRIISVRRASRRERSDYRTSELGGY